MQLGSRLLLPSGLSVLRIPGIFGIVLTVGGPRLTKFRRGFSLKKNKEKMI
jgi:hypothetical protein